MTKIGRQSYIGIGKESVARGTKASASDWLKPTVVDVAEVFEHVSDNGAFGLLSEASNGRKVKSMVDIKLEHFLDADIVGHLLMGVLGTSGGPVLAETGVYTHALTEANVNTKPSFSVYVKDTDQAQVALFGMVNSLEFNLVAGAKAKFKANILAQALSDEASTPAVVAGNALDVNDLTIGYGANIAGLASPTAFTVKEANIVLENSVLSYMVNGNVVPTAFYNQTFKAHGDFTAIWENDTFRDFVSGDTKKALQFKFTGKTLIGATKYAELTIQFAKCAFTNIEYGRGLDDLVTHKISFIAEYSISDSQTMNVSVQNMQSAQY